MIRTLTIETILNGYIVTAGCQRLAYTSAKDMLEDIRYYLDDPEKTEKRILANAINRKHVQGLGGILATSNDPPCPPPDFFDSYPGPAGLTEPSGSGS